MKSEMSIIRELIEHKDKSQNIRTIALALKMDYKNAYEAILQLQKKGIVSISKFGKSAIVSLIPAPSPLIFEAETERRLSLLKKNKDIGVILDYFIRNMPTKLYVLLLFGSHAKGTASKQSDIDLMFIVPDTALEKDVHRVASMIPHKLHCLVFSEKEFTAMKQSREHTVGSEAILNNVILHGIESYYRLIQ